MANQALIPELIQENATVENIVEQVAPLLAQGNQAMVEQFSMIHQQLKCDASERAADAILSLI